MDGPKPWVGRWPLLALLLAPLATAQEDPFLGRAILASKVQEVGSGEVVEEQHADKLLTPGAAPLLQCSGSGHARADPPKVVGNRPLV